LHFNINNLKQQETLSSNTEIILSYSNG
jgi:hypothetical protein